MNTAPGQLVGAVGNLVTKHDNLTTQVGSLATTVTVTDNTINTVAATSRNLVDAMNAMPDMSQAVATIVELEKKTKDALERSNRPRLGLFDGSDRGEAKHALLVGLAVRLGGTASPTSRSWRRSGAPTEAEPNTTSPRTSMPSSIMRLPLIH